MEEFRKTLWLSMSLLAVLGSQGIVIQATSLSAQWVGAGEWNNCFIKNNQEMLLDFADFALQEQPEDYLMVVISRAWCNGSYQEPINGLLLIHLKPMKSQ